jgi:ribose-phosphate pyrophosphokinase
MSFSLQPQVLAGSAGADFAKRVCGYLGIHPGETRVITFEEGNTFVRFGPSVRDKEVFLIQTVGVSPNNDFMEILFWVDAMKRASAASVTLVMPYFSYSKADKKDEPHVSIRARVCADCLETVGVDRVITMDLHSPQVQGFFRIPLDNLHALPILCAAAETLDMKRPVVVSPDAGFAKTARKYAEHLGATIAIGDKIRKDHTETAEVMEIIGDVSGKDALIVDDFTLTCGTLARTAESLKSMGAGRVFAAVSHAVLRERGFRELSESSIEKLIVTDTIANPAAMVHPKVRVVSVAPLFAEAIMRTHNRVGVSELFDAAPSSVVEECLRVVF